MDVYRSREVIPIDGPGAVLVIGNFDGVHQGHQALLALGKQQGAALGLPTWVMTFDPHPGKVLAPDLAPPLLETLEQRLARFEEHGVDAVVVVPFDRAFSETSPHDFVDRWIRGLGVRSVVVGYDFSFGKDRAGGPEELRILCDAEGVAVHVVEPVAIEGGLVPSSSKVREYLLAGRVDAAAQLLGRPFELTGEVVPGDGRGAKIGVPTANVRADGELLPAQGVYAVEAIIEGEGRARPGACNVGTSPTFKAEGDLGVEVHILGWEGGSLHGARMAVRFIERLRPEIRFDGVEALVAQIHQDLEQAEKTLAARGVTR